ncbi:MAG: 1-acyl-sn-glycerol-3-phosphate acyltransferase [Defluviitaleaceae bacterium]|nr:1-acyl-sn-glycerol-3-phosphate acyltransferase [Defluviitaleaceae bacterium]
MRSYWLYARAILWMAATLPAQLSIPRKRRQLSPEAFAEFIHSIGYNFSRSHVDFTGSRIHVTGAERIPEGAVLFVANHQSYFDAAVFLGYIPKPLGLVAKAELQKLPVLRRWMEEYQCVFLDRADIRKSAKAINRGIEILKSGRSLVIFPEGTRSRSREMLDFKAGSFKLATKAKVPVVPVTIDGTYMILEDNNGFIRATDVDVYIHEPIPTADLSPEEAAALPQRVRAIIRAKLL